MPLTIIYASVSGTINKCIESRRLIISFRDYSYGADIQDYFKVEFGKKDQNTIDFEAISPIPFWTDIV